MMMIIMMILYYSRIKDGLFTNLSLMTNIIYNRHSVGEHRKRERENGEAEEEEKRKPDASLLGNLDR